MGRLIDADEVSKYVIIGNGDLRKVPTVEVIPKEQYEARLKADMVAILTELLSDVEKMSNTIVEGRISTVISWVGMQKKICNLIQQKINKLKGEEGENDD